jgi:hypothetical protein
MIQLRRFLSDARGTLGILKYGNNYWYSLELPYINNEHNISSIPTGEYELKWTFSNKYQREMYQVMNVPNRNGIRIHSGNYINDSLGCILLGQGSDIFNERLQVNNSRIAVQQFEELLNKKSERICISSV